jgi:hypothetical protein
MDWFQKWCGRYWLWAVYGMGLSMLAAFIVFPNMTAERRLPFILAILLPLHVFEENTWPSGFHYMINLVQRSERPDAGPMNTLTDMVSNFGAELLMIGLSIYGGNPATSLMVAFFGFGESAAHIAMGIVVQKKLRLQGKRTIYGPGLATALLTLLPLSASAIAYLRRLTLTAGDITGGVLLIVCVIGGLIRLPMMTLGKFQPEYVFPDSGYFKKYRHPLRESPLTSPVPPAFPSRRR